MALYTGNTERARIDTSGRLLVGTSTSRAVSGVNSNIQLEGTTYDSSCLSLVRNSASNVLDAGGLLFGRSRGSGTTVVANNDRLGFVGFFGANGSDLSNPAALIEGYADGTPGVGDMPGRLVFSTTADGSASPTERMRLTSAGLLGLGTTSPVSKLDIRGSATDFDGFRVLNTESSSGVQTSAAIRLGITNSIGIRNCRIQATEDNADSNSINLDFYTNTAVAVDSETVKMRLTGGGLLGIGTTGPQSNFVVSNSGAEGIELVVNQPDGANTVRYFNYNRSSLAYQDVAYLAASHQWRIQNAEKARIDSSGRLLVGTSSARSNFYNSSVSAQFQVEGSSVTDRIISLISSSSTGANGPAFVFGKQNSGAVGGNTVVASNDNLGNISFQGSDGTEFVEGASITAFVDGTPGANDMPGRLVFSTTADGAASPTERMRISSDGTILFVKTSANFAVAGVDILSDGGLRVTRSASAIAINRLSSDGNLIEFYQDTTIEGTISVSGTTVSYNGAHLSRWSQLPSGTERTEILRGSVLSNLDEMCEWDEEDNEQLNRMKVSDVEGDKNVSGVFQCWDDDDDTYTNDFYCAMTGDFMIRIAGGVTVERGDLLMSAGDGTAKPQNDDIIRSKTVAKVTSTNVSCTYEDGSYCVPCVLMAC
jgi:hypothetical protein